MAWATAIYGDRVPILMGLGAARHHHVIPRAIGVTLVALPVQHRPVNMLGGRVVLVKRDVDGLEARTESGELGDMLVTTPEQTLVDLVARPGLGGLEDEAQAAAEALLPRVSRDRVRELAARQRKLAPAERFLEGR